MGNKTLKVGDHLPDVTLLGESGSVRLLDCIGGRPVVVYFYPKDNTPGCTAQACAFRDTYDEFAEMGAQVIGISADSMDSHAQFRERYRLPFPLFADESGEASAAFGVSRGWLPGRVTFVADAEGVIRYVFDSQLRVGAHATRAKEELERLLAGKSVRSHL